MNDLIYLGATVAFFIGSALAYYLGRMTKNQAHGWAA